MNIRELKIRNAVYELGISEQDFTDIENIMQNQLHLKGKILLKRNENSLIKLDNNSYYNKFDIELKESEDYIDLFERNDSKLFFKLNEFYFSFLPSEQEYKTIEETHTLIYNSDRNRNNRWANYDNSKKENLLIFSSMNDLKQHFKTKFENGDILKSINQRQVEIIKWVFDIAYIQFEIEDDIDSNIKKIVKVIETNNTRIALRTTDGDNLIIKRYTIDDEKYNYIDEGRYIYEKLYFDDDVDVKKLDLKVLNKMNEHTFQVIDAETYKNNERRFALKIRKEQEEQELKENIKIASKEKIEHMDNDTEIIYNGIKFTNKGIFYADLKLTGHFRYSWREYYANSKVLENLDSLDFNVLFEQFCDTIYNADFKGILGKIQVTIKEQQTENARGDNVSRWFINDIRINKDDVLPLLKRAICFETTEEYENLLKEVSKCNLTFHNILSNGLVISFSDSGYRSRRHGYSDNKLHTLKLTIKRNGCRNVLVLGDKEFKIKNTNSLLNISILNQSKRYEPMFFDIIEKFKTLFEMSDDEIIELMRQGLKEQIESEQRSEQFLKETLELFKISEIEVFDKKNDDKMTGFLITGTSGQQYFLTKELKIFKYPSMEYVCIVDKSQKNGFKNDRIVSRIFALANDSVIASDVHTLKVKGGVY